MATKKQKRLAMEAKRIEFEESIREEGLAAQRADRERREKATRDAKVQASKELLASHERKKQSRKEVNDAQRSIQETLDNATPAQILSTYALLGPMVERFSNNESADSTHINASQK